MSYYMKYKGISVKGLIKNIFLWVGMWLSLQSTAYRTGNPEPDPLQHRSQALSLVHTCDFSPVEVEAGELQVEVG